MQMLLRNQWGDVIASFKVVRTLKEKETEMTSLKAILSVTGVKNDLTRKILNCMTKDNEREYIKEEN